MKVVVNKDMDREMQGEIGRKMVEMRARGEQHD
jgi:hypothetical protein